ncbi:hypothetical protein PoB_004185600 [Plakobranchus ocellatus]|uniref:Uncharacterized protein n=1 Tax=Plakobranchus ocellatus TaxID=259542 RepID=A0AAV4B4G0_9GAST|nr:hypothetical protein PoB_004185600 [Plakobranchus ocellatus]
MEIFMYNDKLKEDAFFDLFKAKSEALGLFAADHLRTNFALFSKTRTRPIPLFCVYFTLTVINSFVTFQYEDYQNLKRVFHPSIKASIRRWSELDELLRYAIAQNDSNKDLKKYFISRQVTLLNVPKNVPYNEEDISRALTWFATSRSLYCKLRSILQLPSLSTLRIVTCLVKRRDDSSIFKSLFSNMEEKYKGCVLIIDEIYIKSSVTYRGGNCLVFRHQYEALGFFQQDDIEKHFAHFRMSARSNYYITAEDVTNMHAIDTAKLLSECGEIDVSTLESLHQCYLCEKCLTDEEILTLDELPNKICELSGGLVAHKEKDECLIRQSHDFPLDVQTFTESLSRGGLTSPSHKFYQLIVYFYLFFPNTTEPSCRRRFMNIFNDFLSIYHIDIDAKTAALRRIINILMKCFSSRVHDNSETLEQKRQKVLKKLSFK